MHKKVLSDIYKMPAEWEKQKSTLIGWPYNEEDWPDRFHNIPKIFGQIISSLSRSQNVKVLINEKSSKKNIVPILKRYKSKLCRQSCNYSLYNQWKCNRRWRWIFNWWRKRYGRKHFNTKQFY